MSRVQEIGEILTVPATTGAPALALRPWLPRDAPAMVAAHTDPSMRRWLLRHIDDEAEALQAIEQHRDSWEDGVRYTFAVVPRSAAGDEDVDATDPIGSVTVRRLDPRAEVAEVGYWVAPAARGHGVAARATAVALEWVARLWQLQECPARRFELIHTLGNDASCRAAERLGFAYERHLPPSVKYPEPGHLHVRPWPGP
jgi:RimJ/RimL family protein N-acetyltransferase